MDNLPDEVLTLLGGVIASSLGITHLDPPAVAQHWATDVADTAWTLIIRNRDDLA